MLCVHCKRKLLFGTDDICIICLKLLIHLLEYCQGQVLEGVECHIYLYCFTFDYINLNRAFVIIVLFPKKYSNKKVCANDIGKLNA